MIIRNAKMAFAALDFGMSHGAFIIYVLGEQYLLEQHLIRTMDGEDAVQKGIRSWRTVPF
jgi:hypothetical protein